MKTAFWQEKLLESSSALLKLICDKSNYDLDWMNAIKVFEAEEHIWPLNIMTVLVSLDNLQKTKGCISTFHSPIL